MNGIKDCFVGIMEVPASCEAYTLVLANPMLVS